MINLQKFFPIQRARSNGSAFFGIKIAPKKKESLCRFAGGKVIAQIRAKMHAKAFHGLIKF